MAIRLLSAAIIASLALPLAAEPLTAPGSGVTLSLDGGSAAVRGLTAGAMTASGIGGIELADHTLAPTADVANLPEALRELYLPEGALDDLHVAFEAADGVVRKVAIGWLGADRYLWRIDLAQAMAESDVLSFYINTDDDPATGRHEIGGPDLMLQIGPDRRRQYAYMPDGSGPRPRPMYAAIDGTTIWIAYDHALKPAGDGVVCRFWVAAPGGGIPEQRVELPLGRALPIALSAPEPLQTLAAELAWQRVDDGEDLLLTEHVIPRDGYLSWRRRRSLGGPAVRPPHRLRRRLEAL